MNQRAHLTAALAAGHERLYDTSPTFRAQVDTLAAMLPDWVAGMAAAAAERDATIERAAAAMRHATFRPGDDMPGEAALDAAILAAARDDARCPVCGDLVDDCPHDEDDQP